MALLEDLFMERSEFNINIGGYFLAVTRTLTFYVLFSNLLILFKFICLGMY